MTVVEGGPFDGDVAWTWKFGEILGRHLAAYYLLHRVGCYIPSQRPLSRSSDEICKTPTRQIRNTHAYLKRPRLTNLRGACLLALMSAARCSPRRAPTRPARAIQSMAMRSSSHVSPVTAPMAARPRRPAFRRSVARARITWPLRCARTRRGCAAAAWHDDEADDQAAQRSGHLQSRRRYHTLGAQQLRVRLAIPPYDSRGNETCPSAFSSLPAISSKITS